MESREEIETTLNNLFTDIMKDPRLEKSGDIDQITRYILSHPQPLLDREDATNI